MTELYIFSQDDKLLTIISEDTGLISATIREELNQVASEPFVFIVEADTENAKYVVEENQVVYRDIEGDLRLVVIKELDDSNTMDGPETTALCEPGFMELAEHVIEDRRFTDREAQFVLDAALQGTRYTGEVEVSLGLASTNFYRLSSVDAIWDIHNNWGGDVKDVVEFDDKNNIVARKIKLVQRLGSDEGHRFEIDENTTEIARKVISYPKTAMYGWGASLEIQDDEGEATGGHTRYIDFGDVEWKVANGDPVDKPKGQMWVGDPDALEKYGRRHEGELLHRTEQFSNQDYEDPEELLWATWNHLQENKNPEVNYQLSVDLFDDVVSLGDGAIAIDREFARPIEIQTRIIAIEYDLIDIEGTTVVEMGQFLNLEDDVHRDIEDIKEQLNKPRPTAPITDGSFPDVKPGIPTNVEAYGGFQAIQLYWDYDSQVYISHYEVYGSQIVDFVPDAQHLIYRGRVSAFAHDVDTDQKWYYYIRAVNTRGTPSGFSQRVEASSVRVINDDILFGSITADKLAENLDLANKLDQGTLDWINNEPLYEIRESENRILYDVGNRIGDVLNDISGLNKDIGDLRYQDTIINNRIDGISTIVQDTQFDLNKLTGEVEHQSTQISKIDQRADGIEQSVTTVQGDLSNAWTEIGLIDLKSDKISLSISEVRTDFDNLEIGGRNLIRNSERLEKAEGISYLTISSGLKAGWYTISFDYEILKEEIPVGSFLIYVGASIAQVPLKNSGKDRTQLTFEITSAREDTPVFLYVGRNAAESRPNHGVFIELQVEKGNKATDWSPAPEDKADINQLISYINLSTEGIRIHGERVHISGQTIIDDAVIGTAAIANLSVTNAKIGTLAVGTAQLQDAAITNVKIANATIDDAKIASLSVNKLLAGEIDTSKIKIRGGSAIDYTLIDGSFFESRGRFSRTWRGSTKTHDIKLRFENGYLRARNDSENRSLYFTDFGISTQADGVNASGTLEFFSTINSPLGRGVTLTSEGVTTIEANGGAIHLDASTTINAKVPIYSPGFITSSTNAYIGTDNVLHVVNKGFIDGSSGIPIYRDVRGAVIYGTGFNTTSTNAYIGSDSEVRMVSKGYVDGSTSTPVYRDVRANIYFGGGFVTSSTHAYIGTDDELRVQNKGLTGTYRNVRANGYFGQFMTANAGQNAYIGSDNGLHVVSRGLTTGVYRAVRAYDFITDTSLRDNKKDIEAYSENTLATFRNANVYTYRRNHESEGDKLQLGMMLDEMPIETHSESNDAFALYALTSYVAKGVKDLVSVTDKHGDRLDAKDLEIQFLQQKIKQLEEQMAA